MTGGHIDDGLTVWLSGECATTALDEAPAMLRELGRPATVVTAEAAVRAGPAIAAAGIVVLCRGEAGGRARAREAHARAGVRFEELEVEPEAGHAPPRRDPCRQVLDLVDHGREVASRPIFVIGNGRSGTTWVMELLSAHPRVAGLFESLIFAPERFGHLKPGGLDAYRNFDRVGHPYGLGQLIDREEALRDARRQGVGWMARAVGAEHDWLVEKTPAQAVLAPAIAEILPQARFVHVLRDGRDVVASLAAWARNGWVTPVPPRHALVPKPLAWRAAAEWVGTTRRVAAAAPHLPLTEVRYEQLRAEPVETVLGLFEFCEIPCDRDLASEIVQRCDFSRHSRTGDDAFRRRGVVGDWRRSLSPYERVLVAGVAGGALAERGYEQRPPTIHRAAKAVRRLLSRARRR